MYGTERLKKTKQWRIDAIAGVSITALFFILNRGAYQSFFQDDEFDTLSWIGGTPLQAWIDGLFSPVFSPQNFRPVGHFYYLVMHRIFRLEFWPYVFVLQLIHLFNVFLVWRLARRLGVGRFGAFAGAAFFALNMAAIDAFWKPMYIFDVLCCTFCLVSVLLFAHGRWILSFVAFWLAYKAKEVAVMLPLVLAAYELWFGKLRERWWTLLPFFAVSLSFGTQAMLANRSREDLYAFHLTVGAVLETARYYSSRILLAPFAGAALLLLPLVFRDRRVVWGVGSMLVMFIPLLLLPGRVFCAYTYVPLAFLTVAFAALAGRYGPIYTGVFFLLWLPLDISQLRVDRRATLAMAAESRPYFEAIQRFAAAHPRRRMIIYDAPPSGYHDWGITGMVRCAYDDLRVNPLFLGWAQTPQVIQTGDYTLMTWDHDKKKARFELHGAPQP